MATTGTSWTSSLHILYLAVFVDLLGVALVVPNLVHRFRELGGSPASFGVLSSAYAASQLVGGLLIGYLGDRVIGRKKTLLISFVGAGVSYLVVGLTHTLPLLVVSRVLVGLTKQTMTVSTALVAELTSEEVRTESLGRLSSATTLAFTLGQSAGGLMVKYFGSRLPCVTASMLFALDFLLVAACLPESSEGGGAPLASAAVSKASDPATASALDTASPRTGGSRVVRLLLEMVASTRLGNCLPSATPDYMPLAAKGEMTATDVALDQLASKRGLFKRGSEAIGMLRGILALRLAYGFLMRSAYSLHSLYEANVWAVTPAISGSLASYNMLLGLLVDSFFIGRVVRAMSEERLLCLTLLVSALNAAAESQHRHFAIYAGIHLPVSQVAGRVGRTCLSSLFSKSVDLADQGLALSVLDVCNAAIGIVAPLYGGAVLGRVGVTQQPLFATAHYLILLPLTGFFASASVGKRVSMRRVDSVEALKKAS